MKNYFIAICLVLAYSFVGLAKNGARQIGDTDLVYTGPGTLMTVEGDISVELSKYPLSDVDYEAGTILVKIFDLNAAKINNTCKIAPTDKGSQESIIVIIEGNTKKIDVDFGQAKGAGTIPYMYVNGAAKKIQFKGVAGDVGRVVVENSGSAQGVMVQNVSKNSGFKDLIVMGPLKRAQANSGGFGGPDQNNPGVLMINQDSPKAQIKTSPKASLANLLVCQSIDTNVFADFKAAYDACMGQRTIVDGVESVKIKMLNTKKIENSAFAVDLDKKIKAKQVGKKIKFTGFIVGPITE